MSVSKTIVVTGGAGFIGSAVIRHLANDETVRIVNVDKLTYAGNLGSLKSVEGCSRYYFEQVDICSAEKINAILRKYQPDAIMHLAAESHVDRSIDGAAEFIETNIVGTYVLLEAAREYWQTIDGGKRDEFRFHHISTDEVYGDLSVGKVLFTEETSYAPSSPYSASKASSDHLVRAWYRTYGLPVIISNCSNNYGPYQFPEKLIPLVILNALAGKPLPVYGDGKQIRDWLYVDDHVQALLRVLTAGQVGETYNIGGHNEMMNIDVVKEICHVLDELRPERPDTINSYADLISFVSDRPGHDRRYAINASKIQRELGWQPQETFESGIRKTVEWYLANLEWCLHVQDGSYQRPDFNLQKAVMMRA